MVVHSEDGLDELSLGAPTHVAELRDGVVRTYALDASQLGFAPAAIESITVGSPAASLAVIRSVLGGDPGPAADITVLNAAAAIYVSGIASSVEDGIGHARVRASSPAGPRVPWNAWWRSAMNRRGRLGARRAASAGARTRQGQGHDGA